MGLVFTCLFFGFVIFPIFAITTGWNQLIVNYFQLPVINNFQASLLWAMTAILLYLALKNSISFKVHSSEEELTEDEINVLLNEAETEEIKENQPEDFRE